MGRHISRTEAASPVRRYHLRGSVLLRLSAALFLGVLLLGTPGSAGAAAGEAPAVDLQALDRLVEGTGKELEQMFRLHNAFVEATERMFDCVPDYSRANFLMRVVEGAPGEVVDYLREIDFDPVEFDVIARHCLFPSRSLAVRPGLTGRYVFPGKINGVTLPFLVDTGASGVAVSAKDAQRAGLVWGRRNKVRTAGGLTIAFETVIDRLELGPKSLSLKKVKGMIIPDFEGDALFGTPLLGQYLDMHTVGPVLFLQAKQFNSDAARRVSRMVRALLARFHILHNECGNALLRTAATLSCLSVDPASGRVPEAVKKRIGEKYGPVMTALRLD